LLVWAAHAERGTNPPEVYDGEWFSDEAFMECSAPKEGQRYRPITCGSLWLPGDFEFSFDFEDLTGQKVHICANASLQQSLRDLNESTFGMSTDDLASALHADFGEKSNLEVLARFGLALFQGLQMNPCGTICRSFCRLSEKPSTRVVDRTFPRSKITQPRPSDG
jgi:hypothetical protein